MRMVLRLLLLLRLGRAKMLHKADGPYLCRCEHELRSYSCPKCSGRGKVYDGSATEDCSDCDGLGVLYRCQFQPCPEYMLPLSLSELQRLTSS